MMAHWLALPPAAIGMLSLTGYAYGVERFYNFGPYVSVAFNTASDLCALAVAVLLTHPNEGWSRSLVGHPTARAVFKRLLPWSLVLPLATGGLVRAGVHAGYYDALFGLALFAVLTTGTFVWLSWNATCVARRVAAALAASEAHLHRLSVTTPSKVFVTDAQGRCTSTSAAFNRFVGRPAHELLDDGWQPALHPQDAGPARLAWQRATRAETPFEAEYRLRRRDGVYITHLWRARPMSDDAGAVTGWISVLTDIQEIIDVREALRRTNQQLEATVASRTAELARLQKMDAIGQLTGGVVHDINNLLTPIMGSLDLLQRQLPGIDNAHRLTIETALQATSRASTLVQHLLAFARHQELQPRVIDLGALLAGLENLVKRSMGGIQVLIRTEPDLPAAKVDPNQLEMAILNLAINGRDAMPDGGTLTIQAQHCHAAEALPEGLIPGRYVRVSVTDTGTGMDAETMRRAVKPFFSTKEQGKGTGLGLAMVQTLAAQSGGALVLRSKPSQGTTAELWLPSSEEAPPRGGGMPDVAAVAAAPATVLLVDDEELVRTVTSHMLADLGYTVIEASSAARAMQHLIDTGVAIDILVTDFLMPETNGAQLASQAKRLRPELPILLISGYATITDELQTQLPRLAKPFRQAHLAACIARLLGRPWPPGYNDAEDMPNELRMLP